VQTGFALMDFPIFRTFAIMNRRLSDFEITRDIALVSNGNDKFVDAINRRFS